MKKYLSGLVAALMLSAGLVALAGPVAQAASARACGDQYQPACVDTKPEAPKTVTTPAGKKPKVPITIGANSNVKPAGKVVVKLAGKKLPKKLQGKEISFQVKKGKVVVKLPKLKPGKYKFKFDFVPKAGTAFEASKGKITVVVKKR
ncbi:hypothetical protein KM427_22770 [Nocardioides sp. LMS-CY]|uniref:hypothetical protein n=1 Tax=Nocardioides sp. (strain LMS-CY) TaxID=2840457 RepID=UPI001C004484|nr:hypothetical protein [Nocardioides sp. LMS-CY]QWF21715.1 hypothetical protein KM427_22770 [Nocardioides sp. LMS-CY]